MDNLRPFLLVALGCVLFLMYQQWESDYSRAPVSTASQSLAPVDASSAELPASSNTPGDDVPQPSVAKPAQVPEHAQATPQTEAKYVQVLTDVFDLRINTAGADIQQLALLQYPVSVDEPDNKFRLLDDQFPFYHVTQSGLLSNGAKLPNHKNIYVSAQNRYEMGSDDELKVPFDYVAADGTKVRKVFTFTRGSYAVQVDYEVTNTGNQGWNAQTYGQLVRTEQSQAPDSQFLPTFQGAALYKGEMEDGELQYIYEKVSFDELANQTWQHPNGWAAMLQHYFVAAIVPTDSGQQNVEYYGKVLGATQQYPRYAIGLKSPLVSVPAGQTVTISSTLFLGPKLAEQMEQVATGLPLTVDYGFFTFLSEPLFWLLSFFYGIIANWGVAIILLTLLVKTIFYPLSVAQYRSMAKMRKVAPRIKSLRERYGEDKQGLQQAMMDLYKKEKVNPVAGCLPLLVQMPVFLALYYMLLESVELRQASFLWMADLSAQDPFFILPILFAASMYVQQKLSATTDTMDPIQAKVFQVMPIGLGVFFIFFPSGLVLYWVVNNVVSITQQWIITRRIEAEDNKK